MAKTLKERMKEKKQELKDKGNKGLIYYLKPDQTVRVRILNMGEENEFIKEVVQYYLGPDIKGVISPDTFGEPCGITEAYHELRESEDDDEKDIASKLSPRMKYLAFVAFYKDQKGKEIDESLSPRFILLTSGMYQDILTLYLDEDEWGDMTSLEEGYDLKLTRTGSGKTDTEYSVSPCRPTPIPKSFKKVYDLDEEVRKVIPSYEKTKEYVEKFLGLSPDEDEVESPRKKTGTKPRTKTGKKNLKKRRNPDLDE